MTPLSRRYRRLLGLLPKRFREERRREMERLFDDMCEQRTRDGRSFGIVFWTSVVWDLLHQAAREHVSPTRPPAPSQSQPFGESMATLLSDLRFAFRTMVRQPVFAGMIVTMLALGVAGNAAVFRIFNGLFLRPLPFDHPEQLLDLDETAPQWNLEYVGIAYPDFHAWREENQSFRGMAVLTTGSANFSMDGADAARIQYLASSYDLAQVLGIDMHLGRFYGEDEDIPDGPSVLVLSYHFWQTQFGGDRDVIGRTIIINSRPNEIIGVLEPRAGLVADAEVWAPLGEDPTGSNGWYLEGIGRLKPGATIEQARADLLTVHRGMIEDRPVNETTSPVMQPIRDRFMGEYEVGGAVLLGAVAVVLLIACANIAGLMLARSLSRGREIGIRVAMGAGRSRIIQQLLTESLVLALIGSVFGTALGYWGSSLLVSRMATQFPAWVAFDLDGRFVVFTVAITAGAAILFGLVPAFQATGVNTRGVLSAAGTRTTATVRKRRSMSALVAGEVALALMLLIVAGLTVQDLRQLQRIDPGFRTENVLSYRISLPSVKYDSASKRLAFFEDHLERVQALPGVVSAAAANNLPLNGHWGWFFSVEGAPERDPNEPNPVVLNRVVTPDYFEMMGVSLVSGRVFDGFDGRDEGTYAAIVNETFVKTFFQEGDDPVGRRITTGGPNGMTVVGVSKDVKHYGVDEEMRPGVYQPLNQLPRTSLNIGVRTAGDPVALIASIRGVTQTADPDVPLYDIDTMGEMMAESLWTRRATSWLIAAFSSVALILSIAGIYGVISYGVNQRFHEISIRMALGARDGQVLSQVMRQGMLLVGIGIAAGLGAAYAAAKVVAGLLVGVSATDPIVYVGVAITLTAVAGVANFIPAWRAAHLQPMRALRGE